LGPRIGVTDFGLNVDARNSVRLETCGLAEAAGVIITIHSASVIDEVVVTS
jgi:hypothetical protein